MKQNNISLILAAKGSGKSILANALALAQDKPVFFITPLAGSIPFQYDDIVNPYDLELDDIESHRSYIITADYEEFDEILTQLSNLENILIVIDEIDMYAKAKLNNQSALYKIINLGRHSQIDLIAIARRPAETPTSLRGQCDTLYLGRIGKEVNNIKYIREWLGDKYADAILELDSYSFIKVSLSSRAKDALIRLDENLVKRILFFSRRLI